MLADMMVIMDADTTTRTTIITKITKTTIPAIIINARISISPATVKVNSTRIIVTTAITTTTGKEAEAEEVGVEGSGEEVVVRRKEVQENNNQRIIGHLEKGQKAGNPGRRHGVDKSDKARQRDKAICPAPCIIMQQPAGHAEPLFSLSDVGVPTLTHLTLVSAISTNRARLLINCSFVAQHVDRALSHPHNWLSSPPCIFPYNQVRLIVHLIRMTQQKPVPWQKKFRRYLDSHRGSSR